jgi:hypothetical protein
VQFTAILDEALVHILVGTGFFLALLYHWLHGRRFAQVAMFLLLLAFVWSIIGMLILERTGPGQHMDDLDIVVAVLAFFLGGIASWFAASAPAYYWHHYLQTLAPAAITTKKKTADTV